MIPPMLSPFMINPWMDYYGVQAGSGISGFSGLPVQRGHGLFGTIFSKAVRPLLGYLGKLGMSTGASLVKDIAGGRNLKEASKERLKEAGKEALREAF